MDLAGVNRDLRRLWAEELLPVSWHELVSNLTVDPAPTQTRAGTMRQKYYKWGAHWKSLVELAKARPVPNPKGQERVLLALSLALRLLDEQVAEFYDTGEEGFSWPFNLA